MYCKHCHLLIVSLGAELLCQNHKRTKQQELHLLPLLADDLFYSLSAELSASELPPMDVLRLAHRGSDVHEAVRYGAHSHEHVQQHEEVNHSTWRAAKEGTTDPIGSLGGCVCFTPTKDIILSMIR